MERQKFILTSWIEGKPFCLPFYAEDKDDAVDKAMGIITLAENPELEARADIDGERDGHIAMIINGRAFVRR